MPRKSHMVFRILCWSHSSISSVMPISWWEWLFHHRSSRIIVEGWGTNSSSTFFVSLRSTLMRLTHLGLNLCHRLCFVKSLAHQNIHEQQLLLLWRVISFVKVLLARMTITWSTACATGNSSELRCRLLGMHITLTRFWHLGMSIQLSLLWASTISLNSLLSSTCLWSFSLPSRWVRSCRSDRHIIWIVGLRCYILLGSFHAGPRVLRHSLLVGWRSLSRSTTTIRLPRLETVVNDKCWLVYIKVGWICWVVQVIVYISALRGTYFS